MTQKALLQSAGDGTAVAEGYIGEVRFTSETWSSLTANPTRTMTSGLTLPAGTWILNLVGSCEVVAPTQMVLDLTDEMGNYIRDASGKMFK